MPLSLSIVFWIGIFIGGYILIYFSADGLIDSLKGLSKLMRVSPFLIGLLIIGIDPEESVASIVGSANNLPYIAVGNVIGNSIIAITLCFALPAVVYKFTFEKIPRFYTGLMILGVCFILIGIIIPYALLITGIINLVIFFMYLVRNIIHYRKSNKPDIIIEEDGENSEDTEISKTDDRGHDGSNDNTNNNVNKDSGVQQHSRLNPKIKYLLLASLFFLLIVAGGELLITGAEQLIELTSIQESFVGFILIAFLTNVEEITLMLKAIQKSQTSIGIGGMVGKLIWNIGFTYGISGIISMTIPFEVIGLTNALILVGLTVYFYILLSKQQITKRHGIILLGLFIAYLVFNFMYF